MGQRALADRVGVSPKMIGHIERNRVNPSVRTMVSLCITLTGGRIDLLQCNPEFSDEEEYNDARYGNPTGPQPSHSWSADDVRSPVLPQSARGGGDSIGAAVLRVRRSVRPDLGGGM